MCIEGVKRVENRCNIGPRAAGRLRERGPSGWVALNFHGLQCKLQKKGELQGSLGLNVWPLSFFNAR